MFDAITEKGVKEIGLFDENNWQAYRRIIKKLLEDKHVKTMLTLNISDFSKEFQDELKSIQDE